MANAINDSGIKKLKLLYTVVDRPKAEFYLDVLSQFEVNFQVAAGEDKVNEIMNCLEQKFSTIKNGKGIAFAVPFSSVIGVNMYQFLSNNKHSREDRKNENQ